MTGAQWKVFNACGMVVVSAVSVEGGGVDIFRCE